MTSKDFSLVWINGFQGVGKLTVATALALQLAPHATVIDNHQLIDPVAIPRTDADYQSQRRILRQSAFSQALPHTRDSTTQSPDPAFPDAVWALTDESRRIVIFTDCRTVEEAGDRVAEEFRTAARQYGRRFVPVYLECEAGENLRRVVHEDRVQGGKGKLCDAAMVKGYLDGYTLFKLPDEVGLSIDNTDLTPEEAASKIRAVL